MGKSTKLGVPHLCLESKVYFYKYKYIEKEDDIEMVKRKQNFNPMWKKVMKLVDLGERTSFLDRVYMGCTQRECKSNERIIDEYRKNVRLTNLRWGN